MTISGVGSVQALDEYIIQCVYSVQGDVMSRAMLSSTPSSLQVSLEVLCAFMECMLCLSTSAFCSL